MARNRRPCAGWKKRGSVALITDMSQGRPAAILWRFTIPMLLSAVFQQLYNVADSVVAGRFVGEDALAAVGASFPITMIFMAVALGSNTGCSVIISQLFGAKETARMKTAVSTSVIAILALSALLTAGGFLFCEPLMRLLGTPENVFADSQLYLNVYIGGLTFLFLYNICTGVFTALGDSRTPLYFLIASSLANIVMDVVFVVCFHMGVGGVAWATFLCQGVASVLAAWTLFRRLRGVPAPERHPLFSWRMLGRIARIAVPSILQQSFISVGNLFIQSLVNSFGSAVVAGYSAAVKLNTFALTGFTTLGNGLSSFTAQNIGAGKPERARLTLRYAAMIACSFGIAVVILIQFIAEPLGEITLIHSPALRLFWIDTALTAPDYSALELSTSRLAAAQAEALVFLGKVGFSVSQEHLNEGSFGQYDGEFLVLDEADRFAGDVIDLPASLCACVRFRGHHAESPAQYRRLMQFIREEGYTAAGFSREITVIDYGFTTDTEKFVTEIMIPLQKV